MRAESPTHSSVQNAGGTRIKHRTALRSLVVVAGSAHASVQGLQPVRDGVGADRAAHALADLG